MAMFSRITIVTAIVCLGALAAGAALAQPITVTTADGDGADAEVRQFGNDDLEGTEAPESDVNFGNAESMGMRASKKRGFNAAFVRFDISAWLNETIGGAPTLSFTKYRDEEVTSIDVFGLDDGLDNWVEGDGETDNNPAGELTYNNAPGVVQDTTPLNGSDIDQATTTLLGSFTIDMIDGNQGDPVSFSNKSVAGFLNSDTDGLVTFILTGATDAKGLDQFATKETTTLKDTNQLGSTIPAGSGAPSLTFELAVPAPPADFDALANNYADGMINSGTDVYDSQPDSVQSPLFAAQMQRGGANDFNVPLDPHSVFPDIGASYDSRAWGSANAHHHTELFALLYAKTADTGDAQYADAADAAIQYTFENLRDGNQDWVPGTHDQTEATDLIAWGEETSWMLHYDRPRLPGDGIMDGNFNGRPYDNDLHEPVARWSPHLWDRSYDLAEAGAKAFALGLWNHQIADQSNGDFSRHANFSDSNPRKGADFPRVGAWMMLAWAKGYQHVDDDATFDTTMLTAIDTIAENFNARRDSDSDALPAGRGGDFTNVYWMDNNLMMAAEIGRILEIPGLPQTTIGKLTELASRTDKVILNKLTHNLDGSLSGEDPNFTVGFLTRARTDQLDGDGNLVIGDPRHPLAARPPFTSTWGGTSSVALLMLERAGQLDGVNQLNADAYRDLALEAAGLYLVADPNEATNVLRPGALAGAIELMLAAFNETDDLAYLNQAEFFGNEAAAMFFDDASVLPKVTETHDFYEAITGGDNLALALYRLDQEIKAIPEPASAALLGVGGLLILARRRR